VTSTVQRECTLYTVDLNPQQPQALSESARLLADMTLHPKFDLIEVESTKEQEVSELASLVKSIPLLADDLTHMTAFGKYTLGRPLLITPEVLHKVFDFVCVPASFS
jgi:predicted Zn-dependent peptidase